MRPAARLRALAVCAGIGAVVGVVAGIAFSAVDGTAGIVLAAVPVLASAWLAQRVLVRYLLPGRCRKLLVDLLDPDAGPPPAARPVSLELARGYAEALSARDWPAVEAFLGDGFTMIDPRGRRYGARTYRRSLRVMATAYPDLTIWLEGAVAEDGAPEVAWVRFGERGTPRRGPVLDATWWERWTLDPAAARLREMELAGVVRVA